MLEANWNKYKAIMLQGRLSRKVKECIATLISNGEYCITAHSAALRSLGITESQIDALLHDMLPDDFSDKEVALTKFATESNLNWNHIDNNEHRKLSKLEIEEAEMLEALGTIELFAAFNRFVDVMGIETDF